MKKLFNFSVTLDRLNQGMKLTRSGWNGKGMFIFLVQSSTFLVNRPPLIEIFPEGTVMNYNAHIDMKMVNGDIMVWTPSQDDLLANDWYVV